MPFAYFQGGDGFSHTYESHEAELYSVDPCPKEVNEELETSEGTKKFIFTSKHKRYYVFCK